MRREFRYMVVKATDAKQYLNENEGALLDIILDKISKGRAKSGKAPLECLVIEADWPEYEPTWQAIVNRPGNRGGLLV